ncbi:DUF4157 domain-containing protein [Flavisolibacter sp. BT320]|nr:DUF4157 domain-containing protein [Flavisolibacter longurius]
MPEPSVAPIALEKEESLQRKEEEEEEVQTKSELLSDTIHRQPEEEESIQPKLAGTVFRSAEDASDEEREKDDSGSGNDLSISRKHSSLYHSDVVQRSGRGPPLGSPQVHASLTSTKGSGTALPDATRSSMESRFGAGFGAVRVHTDSNAASLSKTLHAQAFTHQNHIYFGAGNYNPHTADGGRLLAHELTHTIQQGAADSIYTKKSSTTPSILQHIQRKEAADNEVRPELKRALHTAKMEAGLINAKHKDAQGKRVGWRRLLEYFQTAMGPEQILPQGKPYQVGKVFEESIVFHREAHDVQVVNPKTGLTEKGTRDALPSWCGIFVFWALKKGGVPMPLWKLGQPVLTPQSAYPPRHVPKKGDIAYKGPPYMHYGIVESSSPNIVKQSEYSKLRVTTVNGNTAGTDNLGGQVAITTDPVQAWVDKGGFFNPLHGKEDQMPVNPEAFTEPPAGASVEDPANVPPSQPAEILPYTPEISHPGLPSPPSEKTSVTPAEETVPVSEEPVATAPKSPAEDPAFGEVVGKAGVAAKQQKKHDAPEAKAAAAQKASVVPEELDRDSQAGANQVGLMSQQKAKPFDAAAFKKQLMDRVVEALPKNDQQTVDMYEDSSGAHRRMEDAKIAAKGDVKVEKDKAGNAIASTTAAPPATEGVKLKETVAMQAEDAGKKPFIPNAKSAAPKQKTEAEISMEKDAVALDDQMAESGVTEAQLERSNEPEFQGAVTQKREAKQQARAAPAEYRAEETPALAGAEQQAQATVFGKMADIHGTRAGLFGKVDESKNNTKGKDESKRKEIAEKLQSIYSATKTNVEKLLNDLERDVMVLFDLAANAANADFEYRVDKRLDDHYGITTVDDTISEYFSGLSPEIDRIFREERDRYIQKMDGSITNIANIVEVKLNEAIEEIAKGKKDVQEYWTTLDPEMQKIGEEARKEVEGRFSELEQSVQNKHDDLVSKLADRYVQNVKKLEETFEKIKDSKKGWLSKAVDAVAGVIKTILELKDMLLNTLRKVAHVIGQIIDDPIGFLGNLVTAVKMGLDNFIGNIVHHFKVGFFDWLLGNMPPGIQFPDKWDMPGIFHFIMQILGLTWTNIRQRAVMKLGEPVVAALEEVFEIFQIIRKEGLAGLWQYIKDKIGDIKAMVIDAIQDMLITEVVKAGITFVVSLLNPVGAFIKACKVIYEIVMFFVNNGKKILALINAIIDSVALIVQGSLEGAAKLVENALAKLVPITIGFLASLLGLGNISEKAQKIIKAIQAPINKAIDWVLDKAIALSKKLGLDKVIKKVQGSIQKGKDWAKEKVEQVKDKGKAALETVTGWWKKKKAVNTKDGEKHTLYLDGAGESYRLMIRSNPVTYKGFIEQTLAKNGVNAPVSGSPEQKALAKADEIDQKLAGYGKIKQENRVAWGESLSALIDELANLTGQLNINWNVPDPPSVIRFGAPNSEGFGTMMSAELLSENYVEGEPAAVESKAVMGWDYARSFQTISQKGAPTPIYVKGHLLNENMGGPANVTNLTPITNDMNKDHLNQVEKHVKKLVLGKSSATDKNPTAKKIVNYAVNVEYAKHPRRSALVTLYSDMMWRARKDHAEERKRTIPDPLKLAMFKARDEAAMNILALLTYEENSLTTGFGCQWEQLQYNLATNKWEVVPGTQMQVLVPHTLPAAVEHYKPVFETYKTDIV